MTVFHSRRLSRRYALLINLAIMTVGVSQARADEFKLKCEIFKSDRSIANTLIVTIDEKERSVTYNNTGAHEIEEYHNGISHQVVTIDQEYIKFGIVSPDRIIDRRTGILRQPRRNDAFCKKYVEPTREQLGAPKF